MAAEKPDRCVIISGSPDSDADFIKAQLRPDDYIICADMGYCFAKRCCVKPDLLVGDFDSYKGEPDAGVEIITLQIHKDDTDTMHCAAVALERGFGNIVVLGAIGGRFDHSYANVSVLRFLVENGAKAKIITENETIEYKQEGLYDYCSLKNHTFSVFPFGCCEIVVSYFGDVEYPARSLRVSSSSAVAISNIFRDDKVRIAVEKGSAIIIVNRLP